MQQGLEFSALMARERGGTRCALDEILVEINENKVVCRKFDIFISSFDADDIRAGCFDSLDKPSRKNGYKDAGPLERE